MAQAGSQRTARSLPITAFAHKTAVISDASVAAVLATLDVAAEGGGATGLDRRHDLELLQAQLSGMVGPVSGPGSTEDVGDLERGSHRLSRWVRSRVCVLGPRTCRACRAGWSQRARFGSRPWCTGQCCPTSRVRADLDDTDIDAVLEQVGREAVAQRVRPDPLGDLRRLRRLDHDAMKLPGADRPGACCPGNSQPSRCSTPCCRPAFHHSRRRVSKSAASMALRSRPPLPCSTRISMRLLSISATLSPLTSDTRRPAP